MNNDFVNFVKEDSKILIITSNPLDFDCIGSGLVLKKYLETLGKQVELRFPRTITSEEKDRNSFLPYIDEIKDGDTREVLSTKSFDTLIFVDGSDLSQYFDSEESKENPPNLEVYPKRVHIDHHLNRSESLGTLIIHDPKASSTMEVLLDQVIDQEFLDAKTATLAYASICGDTGNFRWAINPKTLRFASMLLSIGADYKTIVNDMFFSKDPEYFKTLSWITHQIVLNDDVKTIFLPLSHQVIQESGFDEQKLDHIKSIFHGEIARSIKGYDRGIILREEKQAEIKVSARGSHLNTINMPEAFKDIGGKGGGHFNACSFNFESTTVDEVKQNIVEVFKKNL
jgi:nanoRNase/pAp phosphatase (c-di-AMP/oligoRNAs hydrolase)